MHDSAPAPFIPPHSLTLLLLQAGVLLASALVLGGVLGRTRQPSIVGELCAGVLMGPAILGSLWPHLENSLFPADASQAHLLDAVGQVGVLLLVALAGFHMKATASRSKRSIQALGAGVGSLILPFGFGIGTGLLVPVHLVTVSGSRLTVALFLGVALCVSALPVIAKILAEMGLADQEIGRLALTAAVFVDVVGWCLFSVASRLNAHGLSAAQCWLLPLAVVGTLLVAVCLRPAVRALLNCAGRGSRPALPAAFVCLVLLSAAGAQAAGLEAAFGAFIGGLMIGSVADAEFETRLRALDAVVMTILAPLYFATIGLRLDMSALTQTPMLLLAAALLALAVTGKLAGSYIGGRSCGLRPWEALFLGGCLNARGVIEVIIATAGAQIGIINMGTCTIIIAIALITSCGTPPILRLALNRGKEQEGGRRIPLATAIN